MSSRRIAMQNIVTVPMSKISPMAFCARAAASSRKPPQVSYPTSTSASFPMRLVTGPASPIAGSASAARIRDSHPGGEGRVVVEQHEHVAGRDRQALVAGAREAGVLRRSEQAVRAGPSRASVVQVFPRPVRRRVVHDHDLAAVLAVVVKQRLEAHAVERRACPVSRPRRSPPDARSGPARRAGSGCSSTVAAVSAARRVGRRETGSSTSPAGYGSVPARRARRSRVAGARRRFVEQRPEHRPRGRSSRGAISARRAAVALVVGVDRLDRGHDLVHRREGEQALAGREDVAEAGLLA